jgi:hypothetical protein
VSTYLWLADFWMLKDADTDKSMIFYNPPVFYKDYLTGGYASKGWYGEI